MDACKIINILKIPLLGVIANHFTLFPPVKRLPPACHGCYTWKKASMFPCRLTEQSPDFFAIRHQRFLMDNGMRLFTCRFFQCTHKGMRLFPVRYVKIRKNAWCRHSILLIHDYNLNQIYSIISRCQIKFKELCPWFKQKIPPMKSKRIHRRDFF